MRFKSGYCNVFICHGCLQFLIHSGFDLAQAINLLLLFNVLPPNDKYGRNVVAIDWEYALVNEISVEYPNCNVCPVSGQILGREEQSLPFVAASSISGAVARST